MHGRQRSTSLRFFPLHGYYATGKLLEMSTVIANRWLTAQEAADVLGCTTSRIRQLCIREQVLGKKFTQNAWFVDRQSLAKYARKPRYGGRPKKAS